MDYTCFDEEIHFYFCGTCGVRCFSFVGEGEIKEIDDDDDGVEVQGKKTEVWVLKEGWSEGETSFFSLNAATLEPGQEGLNLKEWTEKGWIAYVDTKNFVRKSRYREPHDGGMY